MLQGSAERSTTTGFSVRRRNLGRLLALIGLAIGIPYITWRAMATLTPDALWLAIPFLVLEVYGLMSFALFVFSVWDTDSTVVPDVVEETDYSIAVLIPTYNEPAEILLPTVAASVRLAPNHETWVLDDGDRTWVREMAEELGAHYLARDDNSHAKAGNLNNALGVIDVDLVAILDADHVPDAGFLTNTIGYFEDENLALVQTPQSFYNRDSFENFGSYHEESMFYRVIQPGKNRWDAAFWCGTSAVLRAEALASVGGVAVDSLTEDLHTTLKLHRAGWRTVFHNEVLAVGLAPSSYTEYAIQRQRWGAGAMQILRLDNPILKRGLTMRQRIAYAATFSGWFEGVRTLGYLLVALAVVISGQGPVRAELSVLLPVYLSLQLAQHLAMRVLAQGHHRLGAGLLFELYRLPASLSALGRLFVPCGGTFRVTPKGRMGDERTPDAAPRLLMLLTLTTFGGCLWFLVDSMRQPVGQEANLAIVGVAVIALWCHFFAMLGAMYRATSTKFASERRGAKRFSTTLPVAYGSVDLALVSPSLTGGIVDLQSLLPQRPFVVPAADSMIDLTVSVGDNDTVVLAGEVVAVGNETFTIGFVDGQWSALATMSRNLFDRDATAVVGAVDLRMAG